MGLSGPSWADAPTLPSPKRIDDARAALAAGEAQRAIEILAPRPVSGSGTCVLGEAFKAEGDLVRADLYLQRCLRTETGATSKAREVRQRLEAAPLTRVSLALEPAAATARIDAYQGDTLLAEDELWLAIGNHRIEVSAHGHEGGAYAIEVEDGVPFALPIRLPAESKREDAAVDFSEEEAGGVGEMHSAADPRPKKFKKLQVLGGRADRAPDPTLRAAPDRKRSLWPYVSISSGALAGATGALLHANGQLGWALAGYGVGAVLLGVGISGITVRAAASPVQIGTDASPLVGWLWTF